MSSAIFYGHQRQCSAQEQLISATNSTDEASNPDAQPVYCSPISASSATRCVELSIPTRATNPTAADMRFSTLSDCSSYYGLPDGPNENQARHFFKDPYLRANCGVVMGSVALTIFGTLLISFGLFVTFIPNEMDIHGWVFLIVGILFFIPGFYHLFFIVCALCNRPGYSLDALPTFNRPV